MSRPVILADNRFRDGTPAATDTATGYDVRNIADFREFTLWLAESSGTNYITVDCGSEKSADCLGVKVHNLHSASALVSVESSDNGADWTERVAPFTPGSDRAFLVTFTSASARHWQVRIVTAAAAPFIAVLILGSRIDFPAEPLAAPFVPMQASIEGTKAQNKYAQFLGSIVYCNPLKHEVSFPPIEDWNWITDVFKPFWFGHAGKLIPFFWAWNLGDFPEDTFYVVLSQESVFKIPMLFFDRAEELTLIMESVYEE